jgi:hypothetical protein
VFKNVAYAFCLPVRLEYGARSSVLCAALPLFVFTLFLSLIFWFHSCQFGGAFWIIWIGLGLVFAIGEWSRVGLFESIFHYTTSARVNALGCFVFLVIFEALFFVGFLWILSVGQIHGNTELSFVKSDMTVLGSFEALFLTTCTHFDLFGGGFYFFYFACDGLQNVGSITLFASCSALFYLDVKRLVAFSTCSHIALMFCSVRMSAWSSCIGLEGEFGSSAFLHLFSHGCVKSLLFMMCGLVIHTLYKQDLRGSQISFYLSCVFFFVFSVCLCSLMGCPGSLVASTKDMILEWGTLSCSGWSVLLWCILVVGFGQGYTLGVIISCFSDGGFGVLSGFNQSESKGLLALLAGSLFLCVGMVSVLNDFYVCQGVEIGERMGWFDVGGFIVLGLFFGGLSFFVSGWLNKLSLWINIGVLSSLQCLLGLSISSV